MSITVVTVAGPNDGPLIERNAALIRRKNPGVDVAIRVVDNSRHAGGQPVSASGDWDLVDGVPMDDPEIDPRSRASSQHGLALNRCLAQRAVATRYLLILDPDFFIYYAEWISAVTAYMAAEELAFFGAPWHPRWFTKYRGFPCVHCLFIDTEKVNTTQLDFTPRLSATLAAEVQGTNIGATLKRSLWAPLLSVFYSMTLLRLDIGRAQDTGSQVFRHARQAHMRSRSRLLVPYVRPGDFHIVRHLRWRVGRLLELPWPDRLSFIPKRRGYFTEQSALPAPLERELSRRGWEEFQWHGRLFGVHMRRFAQDDLSEDAGFSFLGALDTAFGQPFLRNIKRNKNE